MLIRRDSMMRAIATFVLAGAGAVGCSAGGATGDPPAPVGGVYPVTLTVGNAAALPKCTHALAGTVAHVAQPASLFSCQASRWVELPCTTLLAGAVAYASASHDLWACALGEWVPVTLPSGPAGSAGPAGASSLVVVIAEPAGANCAAGGQRIDVGVDTNGDGLLESTELQRTAYVCNGLPALPDAGAASDAGDAMDGSDGGTDASAPPDTFPVQLLFIPPAGTAEVDGFVSALPSGELDFTYIPNLALPLTLNLPIGSFFVGLHANDASFRPLAQLGTNIEVDGPGSILLQGQWVSLQ